MKIILRFIQILPSFSFFAQIWNLFGEICRCAFGGPATLTGDCVLECAIIWEYLDYLRILCFLEVAWPSFLSFSLVTFHLGRWAHIWLKYGFSKVQCKFMYLAGCHAMFFVFVFWHVNKYKTKITSQQSMHMIWIAGMS